MRAKPGRRYRYYITRPDQLEDTPAWRVSAYDLENLVCERLSILLTDQQWLCDLAGDAPAHTIRQLLASADLAAATLRSGAARDKATLLPAILTRVDLREDGIELAIDTTRLATVTGLDAIAETAEEAVILTLAATKVRCGHQLRLVIPGPHILSIAREIARNWSSFGDRIGRCPFRGSYSGLSGAVEKTRTSTGFRPQRPQRCASTNSATTAHRNRAQPFEKRPPCRGRGGPLAKDPAPRNNQAVFFYSGFQPISATFALLGTSVTASLIVTLSPGFSISRGGVTSQV